MPQDHRGLPQALGEALRAGRLVPLVGAGVSMAVRDREGNALFPSWKGLLLEATERLEAEQHGADAALVRAYLGVSPPKLLAAAEWAEQRLGPLWLEFLKRTLAPEYERVDSETLALARAVWGLATQLVITTNYDPVLRWSCPRLMDLRVWGIKEASGLAEVLRGGVERPTLWHVHGAVDELPDIVLTPDGYERLYGGTGDVEARYQAALQALRHLMVGRTFLFVGFSLADEHFVRQLDWASETFAGAAGPHYVLVHAAEAELVRQGIGRLPVQVIEFADFGAPLIERLQEIAALGGGGEKPSGREHATSAEKDDASPQDVYEARYGVLGLRDDFLDRAIEVHRLREEARSRRITVRRCKDPSPVGDFAEVCSQEDGRLTIYALGACAHGVTGEYLRVFRSQIHAGYQRSDPGVTSLIVYGGEPPDEGLRRAAEQARIRLVSLGECQGLIDFRDYVARQTERLERDPVYPPALYVTQRMRYTIGLDEHAGNDALATVAEWVQAPSGRLVLILGDFGAGKTFLLHELARRLGREEGAPVPVLIEMRSLEKAHRIDALVAHHVSLSGFERIDLAGFRFMLREGRIALLFDGFDELALRVSYERAAEHLDTLIDAAGGSAKVVVTSRTQHFRSEAQVKTALLNKVEVIPGHRVVTLQPFTPEQIRLFLAKRLGDEQEAEARFQLIAEVKDLLGLSQNPRMLGFIMEIPTEALRAARQREGQITAASLYRLLIEQWLTHEYRRAHPRGIQPGLSVAERWQAATQLALKLWQKTERTIDLSELSEEVAGVVERLAERQLDADTIAHQVGSGTLLVRDAEGRFSFLHQSVLEWLVANTAAEKLRVTGEAPELGMRELSDLMADFFVALAPPEAATTWAQRVLREEASETVKKNALRVLHCRAPQKLYLSQPLDNALAGRPYLLRIAGNSFRGQNFSGKDLGGATFTGTDLSAARLVGARLEDAHLDGARLIGADLTRARLTGAHLAGTDLSFATLFDADLRGARVTEQTCWRGARLIGARYDDDVAAALEASGAAPAKPLRIDPGTGVSSPFAAISLSPDGALLASGHASTIVQLWEVATGRALRSLASHQGRVLSVTFSPDGKILATGSHDRTVRLWEVATGKELRSLVGHRGAVLSIAFSPDGQTLSSGSDDQTTNLWDVATGHLQGTLEGLWGRTLCVRFSQDGQILATGSSENRVRLWDVPTRQKLRTLVGHQGAVLSIAFSPDGRTLASGSDDKTVRLWEMATGKERCVLMGHHGLVLSVAFHPDGQTLASGSSDNTVRIWDVTAGKELSTLWGHGSWVRSVAFSLDGTKLLTGSDDETARLWEVATGEEIRTFSGYKGCIRSVTFSPDGKKLASGSDDKTAWLWEVTTGQQVRRFAGHQSRILSVAFSPDGKTLASGSSDKTARIWDVATGQQLLVLEGHQSRVISMAFSPDGNTLALGSDDTTVQLWQTATGQQILSLLGHEDGVISVAFSPDGEVLASGSSDKTVQLWEIATGKQLSTLVGHGDWVRTVAFSPDGEFLATGSSDETVRLWEVATGNAIRILAGHQGIINGVAFSPAGNRLISGSHDKTVRVWDMATGNVVCTLAGHKSFVESVAFSPDGQHIATGSADNTIRLWDVATGQCRAILVHLPEGWVACTPDGRYKLGGDVSGGFWHMVNLCRFEPGELDEYIPGLRLPLDAPLL